MSKIQPKFVGIFAAIATMLFVTAPVHAQATGTPQTGDPTVTGAWVILGICEAVFFGIAFWK